MTADPAETLPLPAARHVPGRNARPPEGFFEAITADVPAVVPGEAGGTAFRYGLRLLREGYFWEAHEVWEAVWMACPPASRERHLVQGLIHLANAALKRRMVRPAAAARLDALAAAALGEAFGGRAPLAVLGLSRAGITAIAASLAADETCDDHAR